MCPTSSNLTPPYSRQPLSEAANLNYKSTRRQQNLDELKLLFKMVEKGYITPREFRRKRAKLEGEDGYEKQDDADSGDDDELGVAGPSRSRDSDSSPSEGDSDS